jgi:hypothetical protein
VSFAKIQDDSATDDFSVVDDFVTAKAPGFNKIQQSSTSGSQTIHQESLGNNRNP